jgi:hypothetical protein
VTAIEHGLIAGVQQHAGSVKIDNAPTLSLTPIPSSRRGGLAVAASLTPRSRFGKIVVVRQQGAAATKQL